MEARARCGVTCAIAIASVAACSRGAPRVEALRDALIGGSVSSAVAGAPACAPATGPAPSACLASIATWFGSKTGFRTDPPDQASAATAALAVSRDGRGEEVGIPEAWLFVIESGEGPGADALRLAVSGRMASDAPALGHAMDAEADARALMKAVAASVPGACDTYALLGSGADGATLPPQQRADHSPCVQKDLERSSGPAEHGQYGFGTWRGAEGALALWKDAASALHGGAGKSDKKVQAALATRLAGIDAALGKIALKKLPPPVDISRFASEMHTNPQVDAGVGHLDGVHHVR
jgi:hypothetical protein